MNIPPFNDNVPYDPVKDFTHVTLAVQNFGQALIVRPDLPAKNVQELIAFARKNPGKLTYASAGIGTASHIPAELMKSVTGTDILMVPYRGVPEAMNDLLAGRVDMFFVGTQIAVQQVKAGKVRALAITGAKRWKGMPDVPTMQEAGVKDFNVVNWFGLWLPANAPRERRESYPRRDRQGAGRSRRACAVRPAGSRRRGHEAGRVREVRREGIRRDAGDRAPDGSGRESEVTSAAGPACAKCARTGARS